VDKTDKTGIGIRMDAIIGLVPRRQWCLFQVDINHGKEGPNLAGHATLFRYSQD